MRAILPPLLLALSAAWCGTFAGGATSAGSAAAIASLLGILLWTGPSWRDPLRLGPAGRWLPLALWAVALASWWASPVRRAGWVGLVLLPAFLALPAAVARCWPAGEDRRRGLRGLAAVMAGVSLWALLDRLLLDAPRAAMPLGHHNLLAAWLVILLPFAALLPVRERGPWRLLGLGALLFGIAAVLASRSLLGGMALGIEGLLGLAVLARSRSRRWGMMVAAAVLAAGLLLGLLLQGPRLARIATGEDLSRRARAVYAEAALEGFRARPLLGQGPGSAAWTAALFLDPVPGVNPWGETVGELHSLPLQLAYELGAPGLLLALSLVWLFLAVRYAERKRASDPGLLLAALVGLSGAGVISLGTGALAVTALPLAAAVAAGAALSCLPPEPAGGRAWPVRLYAVAAAALLLPGVLAHGSYDRALSAELAGQRARARGHLESAVRLDPGFPLYRMRLALFRGETPREKIAKAELARRAAEDGHGVALLWTVAGVLGNDAKRPWTAAALHNACSYNTLDPFPPFYQMLVETDPVRAARHGAHALLAEPSLAAATAWERREPVFRRALEDIRIWPHVDLGWKEAFLSAAPSPGERRGEWDWIQLGLDTEPGASLSLSLFRRSPWPTQWPLVPVRLRLLDRLDLPPATTLETTFWTAFHPSVCAP
ncbi:MAG TPA: O-antigen ligase family protein [Thermoanaerobaculia bacterium]